MDTTAQRGAQHPQSCHILLTALLGLWSPNCFKIILRRSTWFRETLVPKIKVFFTFASS